MTGPEWVGVVIVLMVVVGILAGRFEKKEEEPATCPRCGWPHRGVLPCLCAEGTQGRYEGEDR